MSWREYKHGSSDFLNLDCQCEVYRRAKCLKNRRAIGAEVSLGFFRLHFAWKTVCAPPLVGEDEPLSPDEEFPAGEFEFEPSEPSTARLDRGPPGKTYEDPSS